MKKHSARSLLPKSRLKCLFFTLNLVHFFLSLPILLIFPNPLVACRTHREAPCILCLQAAQHIWIRSLARFPPRYHSRNRNRRISNPGPAEPAPASASPGIAELWAHPLLTAGTHSTELLSPQRRRMDTSQWTQT